MRLFVGFTSLLALLALVPYVILVVYLFIWLRQKTQRDLVVLALLGSAMIYAWSNAALASRSFYVLSAVGCLLIASSVIARRRVLGRSRDAALALVDALDHDDWIGRIVDVTD